MKRFGLSANERIKSKKDFESIFVSGKTIYSKNNNLKTIFIVENKSEKPGVKIAAAVSKKNGNAVWRNRVKRLIKDSYRLNKTDLINAAVEKKVLLKVVFSANSLTGKKNKKLKLKDVMPNIIELILRLKGSL